MPRRTSQPDDKGEFPESSKPYAVFAKRNVDVRKAYSKLDPDLVGQTVVQVNYRNRSSKAFACFRSCVSKPSVNEA